jgi:hypothetical protein
VISTQLMLDENLNYSTFVETTQLLWDELLCKFNDRRLCDELSRFYKFRSSS